MIGLIVDLFLKKNKYFIFYGVDKMKVIILNNREKLKEYREKKSIKKLYEYYQDQEDQQYLG